MNSETNNNFFNRLGRAFGNILRFIGVLIIIAGIGAGIYFGAPFLYEKFIQPIESNTARLSEVEDNLEKSADMLSDQISDLESRQIEFKNLLTENTNDMTELYAQIQLLEQEFEVHSQMLAELETIQESLDELAQTSLEHETILQQKDSGLVNLQQEIIMVQAVTLLSRARLFLSQNNSDQSQLDVQAARDLLAQLVDQISIEDDTIVLNAIDRLDLALQYLPDFPVIAVHDVDIAWELLVNGAPYDRVEASSSDILIETPTPSVEPTPTVTP